MVTFWFMVGSVIGGVVGGLMSLVLGVGDALDTKPDTFGKDESVARKGAWIIFYINLVIGTLLGALVGSLSGSGALYALLTGPLAAAAAICVPVLWAKWNNASFQLGLYDLVKARLTAETRDRAELVAIQEQLNSTRTMLERACAELALPEETRKERDRLAGVVRETTGKLQSGVQELDRLRADAASFRQFQQTSLQFRDLADTTAQDLAAKLVARDQLVRQQAEVVSAAKKTLQQAADALQALLKAQASKPVAVEDVLAQSQSALDAAQLVTPTDSQKQAEPLAQASVSVQNG